MVVTSCIYCNSTSIKVVKKAVDVRYFPEDVFEICECNSCGITFTAPRLDEGQIKKYYPSSYGAYTSKETILSVFEQMKGQANLYNTSTKNVVTKFYSYSLLREICGSKLNRLVATTINIFIRRLFEMWGMHNLYRDALPLKNTCNSVLYIGSGAPRKFAFFQNNPNIDLHTIDINEEMCNTYKQVGVNANCGTILSSKFSEGTFDVIFFSHVIEHLLHPAEEIKKLRQWLSPDGVIVCVFPDHGSIEWRMGTTYYDVPRHQIHLTHKTAKMMFNDAGLNIKKRIHLPYGWAFVHNRFLWRFLNDPNFDSSSFGAPLKKRDIRLSFILSFFGQSGNVVYYLSKA